jgi:hypothetical protein
VNEAAFLRAELHQVRDDRDRLQPLVQTLTTDVVKHKESTEKYVAELDHLIIKTNELEVDLFVFFTCYRFTIKMKSF